MMEFQIPTVTIVSSTLLRAVLRCGSLLITQDDLRAFHSKHFPHAAEPKTFLHGVDVDAAAEDYYEEDAYYEDLGHYSDGVQRTLTDEQIAMFRHSEIQAILRQREKLRDREQGEVMDENPSALSQSGQTRADKPASSNRLSAGATSPRLAASHVNDASGRVSTGRVEKPNATQWTTSSARTKAKNRRHREKYKAKKRLQQKELTTKTPRDEGEDESDEWDPWHQANGPDVQKEDSFDLDY
ncbi:hypothetical protein IQ07DRAFT_595592 [Pyrenochaeta sp. DS3sAY3a]|nr:hypothetical protein IQ07DRAFT_595592 [Pyrenochaeta sp. DS3sAY3a]